MDEQKCRCFRNQKLQLLLKNRKFQIAQLITKNLPMFGKVNRVKKPLKLHKLIFTKNIVIKNFVACVYHVSQH